MKRVIVDYKKLTPEILQLLVSKYPDGYDDDDIITFKNTQGEIVETVEVRTEDSVFLVKVSTKLEQQMEHFDADDYDEESMDDPEAIKEIEVPEETEDDEAPDDLDEGAER